MWLVRTFDWYTTVFAFTARQTNRNILTMYACTEILIETYMQIQGLDRPIEEYAYRNMHAPYTYTLMYSKVGKKVVNTCTHIDRTSG